MSSFRWIITSVAILTAVALGRAWADDAAASVFADLDLGAALRQAAEQDRLLVAYFTATWCGPCHAMKRDTWPDAAVVAWLAEHAIALQVDIDVHEDIAETHRAQTIPTIIVFRDGEPIDRATGYQSAEELVSWLEGLRHGRTRLDDLRQRATADDNDHRSVIARYELAAHLMQMDLYDEATEHYVWLWEQLPNRNAAMAHMRNGLVAEEMQEVAELHAPARERFEALRDGLEQRLRDGAANHRDLEDWLVLNGVVGDLPRTLAWFDRVKHRDDAGRTFERVVHHLEDILIEEHRWADVALLYPDPVQTLHRQAEPMQLSFIHTVFVPDAQARARYQDYLRELFYDKAGVLYAAMLAGGRDTDAAAVADFAIATLDDDQTRCELVGAALQARQARAGQLELLRGPEGMSAEGRALAERVRRLLEDPDADAALPREPSSLPF